MNIIKINLTKYISIFIFSCLIIKNIKCIIIIPIETLSEENYIFEKNNSHTSIINKYYFRELYTIFEMGTPIQKVFLYIRTKNQDYEIISTTSLENKNKDFINLKYNLKEFYKSYNLFNEKKSLTYKTEGCREVLGMLEDEEEICRSNDKFLFYDDISTKQKNLYNNLFFKLVIQTDNDIPGEIGLGLFDKSRDPENNFLKILKSNDLINNYNWYFEFDSWNSTKGRLIIGSLPHEIHPDKFSEKNLLYTNVDINSFTLRNWKIEYDKIYINKDVYLLNKKAEFAFDSDIIIGTNELELKLNDYFFNNFIYYKKCFNDTIKLSYYFSGLKFFYCHINLKNTLYDLIPSVKLYSNDLNYTFEMDKDELFIIEGNYIYLKILFPIKHTQNYFILGRSFTLKYPFVFNPDLNKICFYMDYAKDIINEEKIKNDYGIIIKIIIIIIFLILFIMFSLKLGMAYKNHRKKRTNEIIDNYDYKDINKNNLVDEDSNNNIEMKINI